MENLATECTRKLSPAIPRLFAPVRMLLKIGAGGSARKLLSHWAFSPLEALYITVGGVVSSPAGASSSQDLARPVHRLKKCAAKPKGSRSWSDRFQVLQHNLQGSWQELEHAENGRLEEQSLQDDTPAPGDPNI